MATQIPARPETQLESIIADADLEYLGTNEFETIGNKLKSEIFHFQSNMTDKQWDEIQVKFLKNHRYFTPWCKKYREPQKQRNLSSVIERLNQ
ncbi:MAG TPA: hypothetical protein PKD85_12800 [Saprospiraceae bacterium]|nr:hypothetical protein [Saprospiraceae bacterium]